MLFIEETNICYLCIIVIVEKMERKVISISEQNYQALRKLGFAGDSMNFVVGKLLRIAARGVIAEK